MRVCRGGGGVRIFSVAPSMQAHWFKNESMVSFVSRRYMRGITELNFSGLFVRISTFNLEKIRMDYSCHGRYKGIKLVFGLFSLFSS